MSVIVFKDGGQKIVGPFALQGALDDGWRLTKDLPEVDPEIEKQIETEKDELIEKLKAEKAELTEDEPEPKDESKPVKGLEALKAKFKDK